MTDNCKQSLINDLSLVNWDKVLHETDANEAYNIFVNTFTQVYDNNCPIKKICSNPTMMKNKPWVTRGLQNACKKKNNLYKQFVKLRTKEAECRYKKSKTKLISIPRFSEKAYYNELVEKENIFLKELGKF